MPTGPLTESQIADFDRDGYLFLADRRSAVIRSGGVSIYPVEVEAVQLGRKKMFFNPEKAVRELGLPQTPVREALRKAVEWYLANGYVKERIARRIARHQARGLRVEPQPES